MTKRLRTPEEIKASLDEQIELLTRSADAYDDGHKSEAKRMAGQLRILLHESRGGKSLLAQAGLKDAIRFKDTAWADTPGNPLSYYGLIANSPGAKYDFIAPLDDNPPKRLLPFEDWWEAIIFRNTKGVSLTRHQVVMTAADQDGGAHVDPALNEDYDDLAKGEFLQWRTSSDGRTWRLSVEPERAALRQITHEVLSSVDPTYKKAATYEGAAFLLHGATLHEVKPLHEIPSTPLPPGTKPHQIGRNQTCPCGSSKKWKHCHGQLY